MGLANVGVLLEEVRENAFDANGNMKSEAELKGAMEAAASAEPGVFDLRGQVVQDLSSDVLDLTNRYFDGNATAATEFFLEHGEQFANEDANSFLERGAPAFIEGLRAQEAQEAARLAAAQTAPDPTPAAASTPEEAAPTATSVAAVEQPVEVTAPGVSAPVAGAAAAATTVAAVDPAAAARAAMDANTTEHGTTNFLEMLRNMDMDQFDANGDGQVGLGELFMGIIEQFMGEEGSGQFREMMNDQDGIFAQMFGGAGTHTIGTPLAEQAGLNTGGATQLDPSTNEPVPTPGQQPAFGSVTPGMDPNDPNVNPNLAGPRAPGMQA